MIPAELTESLREALAQALASGALQDTEAAALVSDFLVSGSLDRPVDTTWFRSDPNQTYYWVMWNLYWWQHGCHESLNRQIPALRRHTPPEAI